MSPQWLAIQQHMARLAPDIAASLNPPATVQDITRLQTALNLTLPPDFCAYLLTFNASGMTTSRGVSTATRHCCRSKKSSPPTRHCVIYSAMTRHLPASAKTKSGECCGAKAGLPSPHFKARNCLCWIWHRRQTARSGKSSPGITAWISPPMTPCSPTPSAHSARRCCNVCKRPMLRWMKKEPYGATMTGIETPSGINTGLAKRLPAAVRQPRRYNARLFTSVTPSCPAFFPPLGAGCFGRCFLP